MAEEKPTTHSEPNASDDSAPDSAPAAGEVRRPQAAQPEVVGCDAPAEIGAVTVGALCESNGDLAPPLARLRVIGDREVAYGNRVAGPQLRLAHREHGADDQCDCGDRCQRIPAARAPGRTHRTHP